MKNHEQVIVLASLMVIITMGLFFGIGYTGDFVFEMPKVVFNPTIKQLAESPENYLGQEVTITGKASVDSANTFGLLPIGLIDNEGYAFILSNSCFENRVFEKGKTYTVTGTISEKINQYTNEPIHGSYNLKC